MLSDSGSPNSLIPDGNFRDGLAAARRLFWTDFFQAKKLDGDGVVDEVDLMEYVDTNANVGAARAVMARTKRVDENCFMFYEPGRLRGRDEM